MMHLDADSFTLLSKFLLLYFKYIYNSELDDFDYQLIDILDEYNYLIENERSN